jgi:hypothetical protein
MYNFMVLLAPLKGPYQVLEKIAFEELDRK